jgi:type IV secretory pathway TraG/TraD family ATPase VirD4
MPLLILCHAILYLCAAQALAQVPESVINRIVELRVERRRLIQQQQQGQVDFRAYSNRLQAIGAEIGALEQDFRELPWNIRRAVESRMDAMTAARLAAIPPQQDRPREKPRQHQSPALRPPPPAQMPRHPAAPPLPHLVPSSPGSGIARLVINVILWGVVAVFWFLAWRIGKKSKYVSSASEDSPWWWYGAYSLTSALALVIAGALAGGIVFPLALIGGLVFVRRWARHNASGRPDGPGARRRRLARFVVRHPRWEYGAIFVLSWFWIDPTGVEPGMDRSVSLIIHLVMGAGVVAGIFGIVALLDRISEPTGAEPPGPVSDTYGSAQYYPPQDDLSDGDCLAKGLFLGKSWSPDRTDPTYAAPGAPVCSASGHHTLVVAPTRTGKGTRVIIPTLLRYRGSALVIDPKGENAAVTALVRADQLGQDVCIVNPWNELEETWRRRGYRMSTYNPLDILDRGDPNVVAVAKRLARAICPISPDSKDRFWEGNASVILQAVFLWLTDQPTEQKTLARARQIISLTRKKFADEFLTRMAASEAFDGAIQEFARPFIDLADQTYSGIMANLSESTSFLSDPRIKAATERSSFSIANLATKKATVYVVIPQDEIPNQKTWLRLMITSAMHAFKHPKGKRPPGHRCLFLIDEFPALGRFDDIPNDIATMSGYGVDFALVVQGIDQLDDHYKEAKGTILNNCAYKWFCNVDDLKTADYLSKTLGKKTVRTFSSSTSATSGSNSTSQGQSSTRGETGRNLLNPDEIMRLGREVAIALHPGAYPQYLKPVNYWELQKSFVRFREKHPQLYWNPPLTYEENPYIPDSKPPPIVQYKPPPVAQPNPPERKDHLPEKNGGVTRILSAAVNKIRSGRAEGGKPRP